MQQGTSEKVAIAVSLLSSFITGFVLAYIRSWRLALALSSILPCILLTGALMAKFVGMYMQYVGLLLTVVSLIKTSLLDCPWDTSLKEQHLRKKSSLQSELLKHLEARRP